MNSKLFEAIMKAQLPKVVEVFYLIRGNTFRLEGTILETVYYDALEPKAGIRIILATPMDDFDIEIDSITKVKEI